MTHPLTPREKDADRLCDKVQAEYPNILATLASGSGDQAELARLADDLRKFEPHAVGSLKIGMDEVRRIIAACDAHAALLAENAALRVAVEALEPFAAYPLAVKMDGTVAPDEYQLTGRHDKEGIFRTVTNGDFQRARQALAALQQEGRDRG